jgi:basic membrane lipoprotein Med (substrate-binding protein (PBP1-ABC) superfamily)
MMSKRTARLLVWALAGLLPAGCGQDAPEEAEFKVALLTSGPVSDAGWYAGAYEGLLLIQDSLDAQVSHQQTRSPAEFDEAFFSYGTAGYDLIFAHGFEYQDAAIRAGEAFPEMTIMVSAGGRVSSNVLPLIFRLEEASYLAGMVAGRATRSGTVGMVGGVSIPPAVGTFRAFEAGVRATRPDAEVLEAFIGSWDDVAAAKEAAVAQLRRGADVLIHNTDAASFGVFQAVREANEAGATAWAMGMNRDQNQVAPEVILGSAVIRIPDALLSAARTVLAGTMEEGARYHGLANGGVDYVPNPEVPEMWPSELEAEIEAARQAIRSGELVVPRIRFVEGEPGS